MEIPAPIQSTIGTGKSALYAAYGHHLAHLDLPEAAKIDMLASVHQIMANFVDRAFGDDPVQHIRARVDGSSAKDDLAALPVVSSEPTRQTPDKISLAGAFTPPAAPRRGKERS